MLLQHLPGVNLTDCPKPSTASLWRTPTHPWRGPQCQVGQADGRGSNLAGQVLEEHVCINEAQLPQVHSQVLRLVIGSHITQELVSKAVEGGHGHIKGQHLEDEVLHAQHLLLGVGVVSDVHELVHLGWVDLFKLTGKANLTGVHSYFEETSVFPRDRVPDQQVSVNMSAIENGVEKFGITEEKGTILWLNCEMCAGTVMQIDNGWINVRSLYQYRHVDSTVLYVDMSLSKLCRDISTLSAVDKSTMLNVPVNYLSLFITVLLTQIFISSSLLVIQGLS